MSITFERVQEIAEAIVGSEVAVENDTVVLNKDVYYANLPADITAEQANAVHAYDTAFLAATGLAGGQIAAEHFVQNPDVESVSIVAPLEHAEVAHRIYQNYEVDGNTHQNYIVSSYTSHTRGMQEDLIARMQETVSGLAPQTAGQEAE
ncbi:hypothetical protein [Vibrio phage BONAISHI]|nr:hypothetical protein [Vibrio phage BONAISHI]